MSAAACLIIGNIRDGEYEGLIAEGITPLLIADSRKTSKIADAKQISPVALYDFSRGLTADLIQLTQQLLDELISEGLPVLPVYLSSSVKMRESHQACTPLIFLEPKHKLTQQFVELYQLLEERS